MSAAGQITETPALYLERVLPGPIERVWDYLTKPELRDTWLAGAAAGAITRCEPPKVLEYAWKGDSVRFELQPRGRDVLLKLTHRRLPACVIGLCTVLAVGLLSFALTAPSQAIREPQILGLQLRPSLKFHSALKFHSSETRPLYGMLGGRC